MCTHAFCAAPRLHAARVQLGQGRTLDDKSQGTYRAAAPEDRSLRMLNKACQQAEHGRGGGGGAATATDSCSPPHQPSTHASRPCGRSRRRGALTGVGNTYEETWANICAGKTGIAPVDAFDERGGGLGVRSTTSERFRRREPGSRASNFSDAEIRTSSMAAARQAYDDAPSNIGENADPDRVGVDCPSAGLGPSSPVDGCRPGSAPLSRPSPSGRLGNTASGVVGIELNCRGPGFGVVSACASGGGRREPERAIGDGPDADIVICGGPARRR